MHMTLNRKMTQFCSNMSQISTNQKQREISQHSSMMLPCFRFHETNRGTKVMMFMRVLGASDVQKRFDGAVEANMRPY